MRKAEILKLRWNQVDLGAGEIRPGPEDTKTQEGRLIVLTERVRQALRALPRRLGRAYVFVNPALGHPLDRCSQDVPEGAGGIGAPGSVVS
jgi:integrase